MDNIQLSVQRYKVPPGCITSTGGGLVRTDAGQRTSDVLQNGRAFSATAINVRAGKGCTIIHLGIFRIGASRLCTIRAVVACAGALCVDVIRFCTSASTTKIGRIRDVFGLFSNLVAGTGFEPVTFGL